jgi:thiopurine S-methyltransferase
MAALTPRHAQTLLITMEYPQSDMDGPPFSVDAPEVDALYGENYSIEVLARTDILANEPRFRARGLRRLHEVCYRLDRL